MTPMEAYRIINGCMDELVRLRHVLTPGVVTWSHDETMAQAMTFVALQKMDERENDKQ